jgi:RecA-family ATPase
MSTFRTYDFEPDEEMNDGAADAPLLFCDIGAWAEREPPQREWAVPDRFPLRNVGLFSGEGAIGKSILLMQLGTAHILAKDWLSTLPEPGPFLYLNAEDDEDELHRRFAAVAAHYDASLAELKGHLHLLALAGQDAVLGYPDRISGLIRATPLLSRLTEAARDIRPKLIGLDTSADVFAGNENDRSQVRQFIGQLRGLAIAADAAVIVATHPSLTGINSGTGLSGNTAWHNSVRARAYMRPLKTDDGSEPDKNLRVVEFMKSNYGPIAGTVTVRWKAGVFVPEPKAGSFEKIAVDAKADHTFLDQLARFTAQGRNVGEGRTSPNYAPTMFARENTGFTKRELEGAMHRLFRDRKIRVETYGKTSNPHQRIALALNGQEANGDDNDNAS